MKVLEKIKSIFYKKSKRNIVLIKSKFGLPSVRVCGVVLTDSGTNPCTQQSCPNDGSCPCDGTYNAQCPTNNPCFALGGCDFGDGGVAGAFVDPDLISTLDSQVNFDIFLRSNSLELKEAFASINGILDFVFGKAITKNYECECVLIRIDPKIIQKSTLLRIYNFIQQSDKEIFYKLDSEKAQYESILSDLDIKIPLVELSYFES